MRKSLLCLRLTAIGLVLGAMNITVSWAGDRDRDTPSSARPFQIGEQFTYEISWMNPKTPFPVSIMCAAS